ncbi:hypothetical protein A374_05641 [Fictibacillus macauensis ZFHKF-1]|uniref:DinB-like domain-containing protein n=1 Tax=Fictibacillus macauensis ZFHKF-1 TaxID=1196324 RepID=I8UHN4_9BACL|nr:DinB family protein [Fictibacillus macauensis]EIT86420.1 hypothetical protein A374_05641 [Fictibacillus macauensis ZFHKF-1]
MTEANQAFSEALVKSLVGERGHLPIARALSDLDEALVGKEIEGVPYTIYQLVWHMNYWQTFLLQYLEGKQPERPKSVTESWPEQKAPTSEEWQRTLAAFLNGLDQAISYAKSLPLDEGVNFFPTESNAGILRNIASHNTYHLGEIVLLRRLFGAWPPPGGGYPA